MPHEPDHEDQRPYREAIIALLVMAGACFLLWLAAVSFIDLR
jgi:hypothetical protein